MHVEKVVWNSIIITLLNIYGKTKDGIVARLDLQNDQIHLELHPYHECHYTFLPLVCYAFTKVEVKTF